MRGKIISKPSVQDILLKLERDNGILRPADVVEAARSDDNPLHRFFTWNQEEAAEKYRLIEARSLIKTVQLTFTVRDMPLVVCGYLRDSESPAREGNYRNTNIVRTDQDLARAALVDEMKRIGNAIARARRLALLFNAEPYIDEIEALAKTVTRRATRGRKGTGKGANQ